jgi:hypothetical protein
MPAKRILTAAMALLLAASFAAPSGARALSADGFNYTVTSGSATVTGCTTTCSGTLVIPGSLGGYPVTRIGETAFSYDALTTVTIPNSVTSIGDAAFYHDSLTTVTIGNSVTSIGEAAFADNFLTTVTIPNSVTSIGVNAFFYNSLTTLTIPNSVTSIGYGAFMGYASPRGATGNHLTTLTIPNSVTSIGDSAFYINALTTVTFLGNAPTITNVAGEPINGTDVFGGPDNGGLSFVTRSSTATGWGEFWSGVPVVTDGLPPETTLDLTPNSTTSSLVASFGFSGTDNYASVTFQCSVDGGIYGACTSPFNTSTLSLGPHMFAVRAVDAVGNIDPTPAIYSWTIESGLPPTDREGSGWSTTLVILAGLTAAASIGLRVRGSKRA